MTIRLSDEEIRTYFYQVATGRKNIEVSQSNGGTVYLTIRHPTPEEKIHGQWLYSRAYERAISRKVPTIAEIRQKFLPDNTFFTQSEKSSIQTLDSEIKVLQTQLKKPISDMLRRQKNDRLERLERELSYIKYNRENKYLAATAENHANTKRNHYFVFCCTEIFNSFGCPFWKDETSFQNFGDNKMLMGIVRKFYDFDSGLEHGILRALCRDQMVKTMWRASVKTGAPFFGIPMAGGKQFFSEPVSRWTKDQANLAGWLMFYQNIEESSEPPPQYILDDDEKLDKYVENMIKRRELDRIKSSGKGAGKSGSNKHGQHQDLIILDREEKDLLWG